PPRAVALQTHNQTQPLMGEPLTIQHGPEGEFRYGGSDARGLRYDVVQAPPSENFPETLSNVDRARYLTVPAALPVRVGLLAHEWTDAFTTDAEKAHAIETHLRTELHYDMTAPSSGTKQPVDDFLFETKRGHCEFFSTAMAVMLREVGIPSRNVVGFVGGTYNHFGHYYAIREQDSHSWVEAYIEDRRGAGGSWQTFDPTPAAGIEPLAPTTGPFVYVRDLMEAMSQRWNRYVVGYNLQTQVHIFEDLSGRYDRARRSAGVGRGLLGKLTRAPVLATIVLALFIGGYSLWARRRPRTKNGLGAPAQLEKRLETAAALYRALDSAMTMQGIARPISLPPLKYAEDLTAKNHPLASEILALTNVYIGARFGGDELDDQTARDFERRVREIRSTRRDGESVSAT
ncbi:MAG: transglutaminase domain-containing protein, partial [Polyangiaceae bacterium]